MWDIKPSLLGYSWLDDLNCPQQQEELTSYLADLLTTVPIKLIGEAGFDGAVVVPKSSCKKIISDADTPALIRLLHGSVYIDPSIVKEFQAYLECNQRHEQER